MMYETDDGDAVTVRGSNSFSVYINGEWGEFTRDGLEILRSIIDQALNTSAEELGGVE